MSKLEEYRRKRHFDRTPEPSPAKPPAKPRATPFAQQQAAFVVQKHAATRLHYDFRLAIDGVLKSWAVPKGPSLNPADKRLAVQTEDHPLDYANFEGIIPKGNYGAGSVMVWDRGTFFVEGDTDASRQCARGEIKFSVQGEKLRGSFVLVKIHHSEKGNEWLMIKHQDEFVDSSWNLDEHDGSVLTGRTLEEIAQEFPAKRMADPVQPSELRGARARSMPSGFSPMLATPIERPFSDPDWLFEIKWDGVRALAWVDEETVTLRSRAHNDMTAQYPELAALPRTLNARQVILDGEVVVLDENGCSDFGRLQQRMNVRTPSSQALGQFPVTYYVFDLLYCDGYDLRQAPLSQRKELLRRILRPNDHVRFSDHENGRGQELFSLAEQNGLEGVIGKRAESQYVSARSKDWVKVKATKSLEAVIGGWTAPRGSRSALGSLLLGLFEDAKLRFIGHAGSGFNDKTLKSVAKELLQRQTGTCPFAKVPQTNEKAFWVQPELVARVRFQGWTQDQQMRAPVFMDLRDTLPRDCRWNKEAGSPSKRPAQDTPVADAPVAVMEPVIHAGTASEKRRRNARSPASGSALELRADIEAELFRGKREEVTIVLDGKQLRFSHLGKVFFPESGYTKRDLLAHYYRLADYILPFLKGRPLVLRRYPNGIEGEAFFQKDVREGLPDWLETVPIASEGKRDQVHYVIANDLASLLYLTNLGCIDHNPWSSRRDDLEHPDYFFFDLDPSEGTPFSTVMTVARSLYELLAQLRLRVFLKTSGATGFHLYLPVERVYTYEQLRMFAEIVAQLVSAKYPRFVTHERIVAKRPAGRVLIDVSQNGLGRPLAAAYSVRAFRRAPVSTPVRPGELRTNLQPGKYNLRTIEDRLQKQGDLWSDFWKSTQRIEGAIDRLNTLEPKKGVQAKRP